MYMYIYRERDRQTDRQTERERGYIYCGFKVVFLRSSL